MRLWHKYLIHYLPKSQLIAQWRELNSIFKKGDEHLDHILINYVYNYDKLHLYSYSQLVIDEMKSRGYKINSWDNYKKYFDLNESCLMDYYSKNKLSIDDIFAEHHNDRYLYQCFYNLQEKYDRGQADFSNQVYRNMMIYLAKRKKEGNLK